MAKEETAPPASSCSPPSRSCPASRRGSEALNKQYADADAKSVQVKPSTTNISVRVLSPGDDGDVSQENNSYADATARNDNDTDQKIDQTQRSHGCGCKASDLIHPPVLGRRVREERERAGPGHRSVSGLTLGPEHVHDELS